VGLAEFARLLSTTVPFVIAALFASSATLIRPSILTTIRTVYAIQVSTPSLDYVQWRAAAVPIASTAPQFAFPASPIKDLSILEETASAQSDMK
jgi:hypothetical protein